MQCMYVALLSSAFSCSSQRFCFASFVCLFVCLSIVCVISQKVVDEVV